MTVANIRKNLSVIRSAWEVHSPNKSFSICTKLEKGGASFSEFSYKFVIGHHLKSRSK
jgi:hypothetical protein